MFDINLRVAEEFLVRQKITGELQNHISFQQPSEEYSLWKGEVDVGKKDSKEHGPTTWAQAALTSLQKKSSSLTTIDTPKG